MSTRIRTEQICEPWEQRLLQKALAALEPLEQRSHYISLEEAFRYCERLAREHSRTFYTASALMPARKRRAIRVLYAFCRMSDDVVDRYSDAQRALTEWRARMADPEIVRQDPVLLAWEAVRQQYHIPSLYVEHLLEGIAKDIETTRYPTFDVLADYCYDVASTVGLMSMHIIGYRCSEAISYAIKLGIAMQLTNILRDIREDWQKGRLYLPLDELTAFDLAEEDIAAGKVDDRWYAFMRFQIDRARRLYREALPGVMLLHPDGRFAVAAAAELYQGILDDIEAHNYDVFTRRAHLSDWTKLARLPGIWWRVRTGAYIRMASCPE